MTVTDNQKGRFDIELADGRKVILIGTAHVSQNSITDVRNAIADESPDVVSVEIDQSRYKSLSQENSWEQMRIDKVLKERKGFLLLANLVLSSFQKRMGADLGIRPGSEMQAAIEECKERNIPFIFSDREIQTTLRRAWAKSNFWNKCKLLASLVSSIFTKEEMTEEELEKLKEKSALQDMMEDLASYLPTVKKVLIDERDQFLASSIFQAEGRTILAVIGAGHGPGIVRWLEKFETGKETTDTSEIDQVPAPSRLSKCWKWVLPTVIAGIFAAGFYNAGWERALEMFWAWVLINGTLSAIGALVALAHPLTILTSFLAAPITSLNPTVGVGIVTGLTEWFLRRPKVKDFQNLSDDISSLRGFYKNRVTRILLVFFLSSLGSSIGTFIGIPYIGALLGF